MAEGRLAHTDARAREGEGDAAGLRQQLSGALDALRGLSGERDAMAEELRAVSEDLEALVKENQVPGVRVAGEGGGWGCAHGLWAAWVVKAGGWGPGA